MTQQSALSAEQAHARVISIRGVRVLVDSDLAGLYGVPTRRLNEQVRRNLERFPEDFSFELTDQEVAILKSQIATSSPGAPTHGGKRKRPRVFTEHGAVMAASLLTSPRAIQMSIYVVRAFVSLRSALASNATLAAELESLKRSVVALDADTRRQFDIVYEAILNLTSATSRRQ
jgi:hypothetical protein